MLNFALKYARLGLSVIPLRPNGKEPLVPWTQFQKQRASEALLREWWMAYPTANVGIVTGSISGVAVVDLDGLEGLESAKSLKLTSGLISITGNGKHLWFRANDALVANSVRLHPGLDIRGDGGYVVAPPSIHESGRRYHWLNSSYQISKFGNFPSEILKEPISETSKSLVGNEEGWIAKALEGMKHGNIDDTLFTVCSRLRADGYSMADARVLLLPHALNAGAEDGHLDDKIENVWSRYEPNEKKTSVERVGGLRSGIESRLGESRNEGLVIHSPTNPQSWKQFSEQQNKVRGGETSLLKTGYSKLDEMLHGGIKSSRLFTVAARTGVGKTNWLLGVSKRLCMDGKRVLLFSTEMPYSQIWERYIAALQTPAEFAKHQLYVCDSFAPNLERVEEAINEIKPDVFMFDHINHVSEEQRELGTFMQGLNFLRRKYGCAGIVTAQLNRSADWVDLKTGEKVTPRMSMIKGSGTIEQASSRVLLLSETRVSPEGTEIVGNLDKNDDGPKGLVHFMLRSNPYKMVEL